MSVQTQIDRISGNVSAAFAVIAEKGVTVPGGSNSDALPELIASIKTGGGLPEGGNPGDVLVRTEDGAVWQQMDRLGATDVDELMHMLQ